MSKLLLISNSRVPTQCRVSGSMAQRGRRANCCAGPNSITPQPAMIVSPQRVVRIGIAHSLRRRLSSFRPPPLKFRNNTTHSHPSCRSWASPSSLLSRSPRSKFESAPSLPLPLGHQQLAAAIKRAFASGPTYLERELGRREGGGGREEGGREGKGEGGRVKEGGRGAGATAPPPALLTPFASAVLSPP